MKKYQRIDNQGTCHDRIYNSLEEMRLQLIDLHSIDWCACEDDPCSCPDINNLNIEQICEYGDWGIQEIEMTPEDIEAYNNSENIINEPLTLN